MNGRMHLLLRKKLTKNRRISRQNNIVVRSNFKIIT